MAKDSFPRRIFALYVIFYAGQAIYNTYLSLFLNDVGFSYTEISYVSSIYTLILVLVQPLWGIVSDKSRSKNNILSVLCLLCASIGVAFYFSSNKWYVALCVILLNQFINPALSLQDNYTLELLEKSRWDFGQIRMGGTLGYAITAGVIGYIIMGQYRRVFGYMAICFVIVGVLYLTLPRVSGYRAKNEKVKYSELIKNKPLLCIITFNILYSMGTYFFGQFYSIHLKNNLGAPSELIGICTFVGALSEVPFFFFASRLEKKLGVEKILLLSGISTTIRLFALYFITNPYMMLFFNLLQGIGFVGTSYCLVNFINETVPKNMRATAQSLCALISLVFARIIFGPIGGWMTDTLGFERVMLIGSGIILVAMVFFKLTFKPALKSYNKHRQLLSEEAE